MPRIYKGSETILKLLIDVPSTSVIDKIKIALFTTDRSIAMEFYADSITLYGNIAYLNAPEWTFMEMEDGIINYIAQGESNSKPFIFERQSNYILKSSDGFEMSEIMNGYYTKEETDEKLEEEQDKLISGKTIKTINGESVLGAGNITIETDLTGYATEQWVKNQDYITKDELDLTDYYTKAEVDEIIKDIEVDVDLTDYYTKVEVDEIIKDIEVDVDLTGYATQQWVEDKAYATEQWVRQQGYVTDFDVNDYVGNEIGQVEQKFVDYYTKVEVDEKVANVTVDLTGYATEEYVNDAIANIDIPEGGDSYTKEEIDSMIGDINNILTSI